MGMVGLKDRLYLRGKTYWYQRHIPKEYRPQLQAKYGKGQFVRKSTKTRDYSEAVLKAKAFDLEVEIQFQIAQRAIRPTVVTGLDMPQQLVNLGLGDVEERIYGSIMAELAPLLPTDVEREKWASADMSAEELIVNAFEHTKFAGQNNVPTEHLIQQMKPRLIKKLLFEAGNSLGKFTPTYDNKTLEKTATNLIEREMEHPMAGSITVSEFIREFYDEGPTGGKKIKRLYGGSTEILRREYGNRALNSLNRNDLKRIKFIMANLPLYWSRNPTFRGMKPSKIVEDVDGEDYPTISHNTLQVNLRRMSSFFNYAYNEDYIEKNHAKGLWESLEDTKRTHFDRRALIAFFQNYPYLHHPLGFIPLLALYHGARGVEVCSLRPENIFEENGIWVMHFTKTKTDKKTGKKGRKVPIHPFVLKLGFISFVNGRKGNDMLFEGARETDHSNAYATEIMFIMNDWLNIAGVKDAAHTFHSFRHTFKQFANSNRDIRMEDWKTIGGWVVAKDAGEGYGEKLTPDVTYESLKHLKFGIEDLIMP